jgi:hypothetical protein
MKLGKKLNESDEPNASEEIEDEAVKKKEKRKKTRLRTRGPYRKAYANL